MLPSLLREQFFFAAVGLAIEELFGLVDYVMNPENNRVKITKKNTEL